MVKPASVLIKVSDLSMSLITPIKTLILGSIWVFNKDKKLGLLGPLLFLYPITLLVILGPFFGFSFVKFAFEQHQNVHISFSFMNMISMSSLAELVECEAIVERSIPRNNTFYE